jgi:outer membrane receptor protein involved in Fe transport
MRHCTVKGAQSGLIALAVLLGFGRPTLAQQTTGTVQGTIRDSQGGVVAGATLELVNEETNIRLAQTSGPEGLYVFNLVPPGRYGLRASMPGFRPSSVKGIGVEVSRSTAVDVRLEPGGVTETVEVTASTKSMDTLSAQVSTNVDRKFIEELPVFNRSVLELAALAPGVDVDFGPTAGSSGQVLNIEGTNAQVNGNRNGRNGFYLDGSDNTGAFRNQGLNFPNPDAVQELQIATSNTSAEFGRQPGGSFNIVTRSGTNQLKGSAAYFFRNKSLNANTWANNRAGLPRLDDARKNFAATIGGPIRRDKTFFFASFMAYRDNDAASQSATRFPTDAMKRGDFSAVPVPILDPETRLPLAGNQIPARLLDPVAVKIANELMPSVAAYNDRYLWSFERPTKNNELLLKIDHQLARAHSLQLSYFTTWGNLTIPDAQGGPPFATNTIPAYGPQTNEARQNTASVRHTWLVSSRLVLETRGNMSRLDANRTTETPEKNLGDFGAQNWTINQEEARKYLPQVQITNGPLARYGNLSQFNQASYQLASSLSWTTRKHNLKLGAELQRDNVRQYDDTDKTTFMFDGRYSSGRTSAPTTEQFGYAFADFMMGRTVSFGMSGILDYNVSNWNTFFYVQDQWRVSPRLTLTPGLRYEIYLPPHESKDDKLVAFVAGHQSDRFPAAPAGHAFVGDKGIGDRFFPQDTNNFAPRLGLAYDVFGDGKLAIRAGAGVYYSYNPSQFYIWMAENNPWRPQVLAGEARLSNPWLTSTSPRYASPPTPLSNRDIANFRWTAPYNALGFSRSFVTPYSLQWNVSVERELTRGVSVSGGYVGNRGRKFTQILPINFAVWQDGAQDTAASRDVRRPIKSFRDVFLIDSTAKLWYDALQATAALRRGGATVRLVYVLATGSDTASADPTGQSAQTANPLNPLGEKAQNQRRHTLRGFFIYQLPFLRDSKSVLGRLVGGWQLSGSGRFRTGRPLNVILNQDWNFDGVSGDRPDLVAPIRYPKTLNPDGTYQWFDKSSFALPGGGTNHNTFGTTPRNAVFGPSDWNVDLALLKNLGLGSRRSVQMRVEAYNVFNHDNLDDPVLNLTSPDFGRILTRRDNRRLQLGLRVSY